MLELGNFFQNHLGEVYVVYGLSFVFLSVTILLQPKEDSVLPFAPALRWLALFGMLHGIKELFEWWTIAYGVRFAAQNWFDASLLFTSYLALWQFSCRLWDSLDSSDTNCAVRRYARICNGILAMLLTSIIVAALSSSEPARGFHNGTRFFLSFPAALMAGLGLLRFARRRDDFLRHLKLDIALIVCAAALVCYGIFAGLFVQPDTSFLGFLPTRQTFLTMTGFPIQVFRTLSILALTAAAGVVLYRVNVEYRRRELNTLEQLETINAGLEKRVMQRTAELQQANRELLNEIAERRNVADQLRISKINLERAQRVGRVGSWYLDLTNDTLSWSSETYNIFGVNTDTPLNYDGFLAMIHPDDRQRVDYAWKNAMQGGEYDVVHRIEVDKTVKWLREKAELEFTASGELQAGIGTVHDITDLKNIELALQESNKKLQLSELHERQARLQAETEHSRMMALLSAMSVGILFEDRNGKIEYVNNAFRHLWAIKEDFDPIGRSSAYVLEHSTHRFARPDHASKFVLKVLDTHEISERFELDLIDGRILTQISYPVTDVEGRVIGRVWLYEDITHERQTAQQLLYMAEHDALTGLYNRHRFQEQLERSIVAAQRNGEKFALIYFDLDEFKYVNDTFGHRSGDTVLVRIASEISVIVRSAEIFARLGGDEFAILCYLSAQTDIAALPVRINQTVGSIPFRFRGANLRMTASVGVSLYPAHGETAEDLVAHADTAMYMAKRQGKNTWALYDPCKDTSETMAERLSWRRRIHQALEEDLFELHFQGVFHVHRQSLSHIEVLIRMRDPQHPERLIMPSQFIPLAENTGQILEIDRWILRQGIRLMGENPQMPALAVNISGRSFDDPGLPHFIRECLAECSVDPRRLIIELTETEAVSDVQDAQRFIESIRKAGCYVCLDDFGSGFSTFAYLKYLDVDILKIDGMFIRDLYNNHENQVFVNAMVGIAKGLGKTVLAECVEDAATLEMVAGLKIDLVQGYYLHRPAADYDVPLPVDKH
ncbi:MAG: EAL domain-containing protein [Gammaproteobacteria bacterium]